MDKLSEKQMKKYLHIILTIMIMLIVSRFLVRIVDATVQIGDDIGTLILLLAITNVIIVTISYLVYRKYKRK